jgi:hypothetical protein
MSKPVNFLQSDVERALAAFRAKDIPVAEVVFNRDGSFSILTAARTAPEAATTPLDAWRKGRGRSAA